MKTLISAFDRLLQLCAAIAAAIFGLTALAITANVALRNTAGRTIFGLLDAVEYGLLTATFLAAPWVLSRHAHVTIDLLTSALRPAAARRLAQFVAVLGFLFSVTFLWFALQAALISAARGSMIRTAFVVPEWWALMAAPIGFALIAIEFLRQIFRPVSTHDVTGL